MELPKPLSFPMALTHDAETNRLFVADAKPRDEAKIISISLNSTFGVVGMSTAVKSESFFSNFCSFLQVYLQCVFVCVCNNFSLSLDLTHPLQ